ncbi:riboflavin biosynthesis protein RibD [Pseudomonas protegens]|uniref:DUF3800 domain-containing protein n=1 Tax=Pseudomonas protegens TaxID=380021 RepID=UPI000D917CF0|nr:DUF3800 domain-containing protein [Pseudomonas protegens]PYC07693.1 riboflavin biosynthesis protein RibD [Pseudomonas protegens]
MHIFIDESGSFVFTPDVAAWSAVAAVVIPEGSLEEARSALADFKSENGCAPAEELKLGVLKDEMSYFRLLGRLERANCTLHGVATDAHLNTPQAVAAHKEGAASAILTNKEKMYHEEGRTLIQSTADLLRSLSDQLYIQLFCQVELMQLVLQQSLLYYPQNSPETLSGFVWRVDRKAREKKTEYESAFETLSPVYLQSMSLSSPLVTCEAFDYSHFSGYVFAKGEAPTYLRESHGIEKDLTGSLNLGKIFREDCQFVDSQGDFGVQLADLLSAGIRRCLRQGFGDNLRAAALLGRLMVQRLVDPSPLKFVSFGGELALDRPLNDLVNMMIRQQRKVVK